MAQKVINTKYRVQISYTASGSAGADTFDFDNKADLKMWLGQLSIHSGASATYHLSKVVVVYDDTSEQLSLNVVTLPIGEL